MSELSKLEEFYGPVISSYTDDQAVDDGVLVKVTKRDRVTRAAWEWLGKTLPEKGAPPSYWAVDLMGWCRAKSPDERALAAARGLIGAHARRAREVHEQNLDGGILTLIAVERQGRIVRLLESDQAEGTKLWLMPNDNGGVTLMFPSDY